MDEVKGIQAARQRLHEAVASFRPPPPQALDVSPYVGMALLQKAIRRGRPELALQAVAGAGNCRHGGEEGASIDRG
jgi:hypothetical protein